MQDWKNIYIESRITGECSSEVRLTAQIPEFTPAAVYACYLGLCSPSSCRGEAFWSFCSVWVYMLGVPVPLLPNHLLLWYTEGLSGQITSTRSLILFLKWMLQSLPHYSKMECARQSPAKVGGEPGWQRSSTQTEQSSAAEQRRVAPAALTAAERLSIIILL